MIFITPGQSHTTTTTKTISLFHSHPTIQSFYEKYRIIKLNLGQMNAEKLFFQVLIFVFRHILIAERISQRSHIKPTELTFNQ